MSIRLLLIEDNNFARDVIRDCVGDLDCEFDEVESQAEALKRITSEKFDVIFLDLGLPEGDGLETFRIAKELCSDLAPVVVLTGHEEKARKKRALEMGVFHYLTKKELSKENITQVIQSALQVRRL